MSTGEDYSAEHHTGICNVAIRSGPRYWGTSSVWGLIAVAAILSGVFFRLYNIGHKPLWDDEVITWLHVLGVSEGELVSAAPGFRHVSDLREVLHPGRIRRPVAAVIRVLVAEDPQHPPIYYVLAHEWVAQFGTSVRAVRLLSALIGVLEIPCAYWLCFELFGSNASALLGAGLIALAPVDVLYSQEAREYSLWLVCMLVSGALFIRALRSGSMLSWSLYSIALAVSLYVFPLTMIIAAAQAFVAARIQTTSTNRLRALAAIALALVLFSPWLYVILSHLAAITASMAGIVHSKPFQLQPLRSTLALMRVDEVDFNGNDRALERGVITAYIPFLVYAIYELRYLEARAAKLFVWALLTCAILPFLGLDVFFGGHRIETLRYFMPAFLAFDLALAALLGSKLSKIDGPIRRGAWCTAFGLIVALRILSCARAAIAPTWWNSYNMQPAAVAAKINSLRQPWIISDGYILWPLVLSEYLDPADELSLQPTCYQCMLAKPLSIARLVPHRAASFRTVVLVAPSKRLLMATRAAIRTDGARTTVTCVDVRNSCPGGYPLWAPGS